MTAATIIARGDDCDTCNRDVDKMNHAKKGRCVADAIEDDLDAAYTALTHEMGCLVSKLRALAATTLPPALLPSLLFILYVLHPPLLPPPISPQPPRLLTIHARSMPHQTSWDRPEPDCGATFDNAQSYHYHKQTHVDRKTCQEQGCPYTTVPQSNISQT